MVPTSVRIRAHGHRHGNGHIHGHWHGHMDILTCSCCHDAGCSKRRFFTVDVLSHYMFFPSTFCLIRRFVILYLIYFWTFCPYTFFVILYVLSLYLLSLYILSFRRFDVTFFHYTFCRYTFCHWISIAPLEASAKERKIIIEDDNLLSLLFIQRKSRCFCQLLSILYKN